MALNVLFPRERILKMKLTGLLALLFLGVAALGQEVQFNYDRSANFDAYKKYQWVVTNPFQMGDEFLIRDIKRAVDTQLAGKGLRRVESDGDLLIGFQTAISKEKQLDGLPSGPPWGGSWGNTRVTSSTIEIGKLVIVLFDPITKQAVWRGSASKTLDINEDPDKNYRNLEKAMAKLFKNYPPGVRKR